MTRWNRPFLLVPNRVWRIYRGGRLIDELRGKSPRATDSSRRTGWAPSPAP